MGPIGCPETSAREYYYTLRDIPAGRRSQLLRGERLKSHYLFHTSQIAILLGVTQSVLLSRNM